MIESVEQADVLIVGAGPTGLMLACQLARHGVRPLIIDRNAGPSRETKALGVQSRTMEIYARLGIAERALELGAQAAGANIWVEGRRAARVPLGDIGRDLSPFPFVLILGQDDNERILGDALHGMGVEVAWRTELVALTHGPESATATLTRPDGSKRTIEARWVAGCDGAHSAVRQLGGIEFAGAPYEHVFFVADTRATGPMQPGELNVYLWRRGFHLFFPLKGRDHWRVVGIVPPGLPADEHLEFGTVAAATRDEVGGGLVFEECRWFATYRIHHRRAARFRDRRAFLLGDAAHIHSPVGAQGMNTGLQDAYNLGWKLALVAKGRAHESLLDTYEAERLPVADRLLWTTDRLFAAIVSDGWLARFVRMRLFPRLLALAMSFPATRRLGFLTVSQTGIAYPRSRLTLRSTGLPRGAPRAGARFPWVRQQETAGGTATDMITGLDDRSFHLIVFGTGGSPDVLSDLGDRLRVHVIPGSPHNDRERSRAGIPSPSYFLVRPDGHIGLAGARIDPTAVRRYLTDRVGLR